VKSLCAIAVALTISGCASVLRTGVADSEVLEGPRLAQLYAAIERVYRKESKFRTDYDPADAPYDAQTLTKNFAYVAQRRSR